MRVRLFTFRFSPTLGAFDDTALRDFIRDKDVIAFREHFFVVSDVPHLACVVTYQDAVVPPEAVTEAREVAAGSTREVASRRPWKHGGQPGEQRPDPTANLDEAGRALFNTVREWRAKTARAEGVPPYVILTNRELVRVVMALPESSTALGTVEGIGPGKVDRYGTAILKVLHGTPAAKPKSAPVNDAAEPGRAAEPAEAAAAAVAP